MLTFRLVGPALLTSDATLARTHSGKKKIRNPFACRPSATLAWTEGLLTFAYKSLTKIDYKPCNY